MSSREQFEAWWEVNYHNGQPPRHGWEFWRDGEGYSIEGDEEFQWRWEAWQAATNAMEAKCAALAAEMAWLKLALEEIEVINRGGQAYCVKDGMSVNPIYARGWNDYRAKSLSVETPATDAFLAEVRASALEYYANLFKDTVNMDVKHNQEFHKGTLYVADQFRKGASQ